ncbi:MAG: polysaccharide biosynthesis protein [Nitrospira sp.]|nr:MAG: polysaccharide biosynthesis protein [Nitrospira sp.]
MKRANRKPSLACRLLAAWLVTLMALPVPVLAQAPTGGGAAPPAGPSPTGVPASSQAANPQKTEAKAGKKAEEKGDDKTAQFPPECLSPQSPHELQTCSKFLAALNPTLADEVRQAVGQGDLQRAKDLIDVFELQQQAKFKSKAEEKEKKTGEQLVPDSPFTKAIEPELSVEIEPFGYNLFQGTGAAPAPPGTQVPVSSDYILGPDDEFTVTVWGQMDGVYKVHVNREGEAIFPRIGALPVAGLSYGELRNYLARAFSQQFKGTSISVAMGQLRSIQVFVVGEVQKPGAYTMGSLSMVLSALFASGGPTKTGTLRDIRLMRNGKVVAQIDLYDFLLKGDKSQDQRLNDQDTVFVPLVGPVVGVAGHVQRPAIYEVKSTSTLGDVLTLAGGIRPTGYLTRVQLERIADHKKRVAMDLDLAAEPVDQTGLTPVSHRSGSDVLHTALQNMDLVKVYPISPVLQKVVYLKGHVLRPGPYELKVGMKINEVVAGPLDLLPEAFLDYARIVRYSGPERTRQVVPFRLLRAFAGDPASNLELQALDELEIYSKEELKALPTVSIAGEVRKPGTYPLLRAMRVSDLIVAAGGFQRLASLKQAELTRYSVQDGKSSASTVIIDLDKAVAGDPQHNVELQELDALAVRPVSESEVGRSVTVQGEVKLPGQYWTTRGERLSAVLKRAGGFTERAYPRGLVLIRESTKMVQQTEIQKYVAAQKQRLTSEAAALIGGAGGMQGSQSQAEQAALTAQTQALDQLAARLTPGRVVVKMTSIDRLEGTVDDVLLEPGDQITIPQTPTTVTIVGAVRNSTSVLHRTGLAVDDYVRQAGGYMEESDKGNMYLVKADGSSESSWLKFKQMEAGDTIVVPQKTEAKVRPLPFWNSIATIFASLATAAVAFVIIGQAR